MTSIASSRAAFLYVDSDVPAGQTLVAWRRDRETVRRAERRATRAFRLPSLLTGR